MSLRVRLLFSFPHYQILALTIILSLVGLSEIVLSVLGYVQKIWGHEMGGGVWGGAAAAVAGVSGILAANKKGVNIVRVFLIASVLSCLLSIPVVVLSAGGLDLSSGFYRDIQEYVEINYSSTKLVHGFLLALAVIQFAICLATTLVCLKHLYWNEWVIKKQHARHLRQIKEENKTSRHRANRASTSSSCALLTATNSGENPNDRHHRRKPRRKRRRRSRENSSQENDPAVNQESHINIHGEQRHGQSHKRESRLEAPNSANVPPISDASRIPEVGSNLMSVSSAEIPSHTVGSNGYDSLRPDEEFESLQPPLPIEEDEELPPYEATLMPVDEESVFPMSISENASCSSSISSGDEEVQAWDSVSQIQNRTTSPTSLNCAQETDVKFKYCPTVSVLSDSSSLPIGSKVMESSENNAFGHKGKNDKTKNAISDPQGVSYHEFSRDGDQILGREKQRTQSFVRERAMAKEGAKSASRKSSVQDNSEREDDKLTFISPLDNEEIQKFCLIPEAYQPPPKPPRQSMNESCTMHEILQQKGSDFLQNKYDSNDSTSSLSKDIRFIKEGPPIQYAPSAELMLQEMAVSPFSEVSWHLLKDFPSKQSKSETNVRMGARPKVQSDNEVVPLGIQNRVVKSELQKTRVLVEPVQSPDLALSKESSTHNVSDSVHYRQRQLRQPPRFSYPPKSMNYPTASSDFKHLQVSPNSSKGKESDRSFCLTAMNISQFSPTQTSTLKKDVDDRVRKSKAAPAIELGSNTVVPVKEKAEYSNYNRPKYEMMNPKPSVSEGPISHSHTHTKDTELHKQANTDKVTRKKSDNPSPDSVFYTSTREASAYEYLHRDDSDILNDLMPVRTDQTSNIPGVREEGTAHTTFLHNTQQDVSQSAVINQSPPTQPIPLQPSNPTQSLSQQSNPTQGLSQQSNPTQSPPQQSNPTQSLSQQSNPTQSLSQQSNPTQSLSQQSNPTQSLSQQSNPTQSLSQQSNPTQSLSQQSNPTQSLPQQSNPTQSLSQQSNPTQTLSQQSNPTQSLSQQSNPTQSLPQQSNPTQSLSQQSNPTQSLSQQSNPTQTLSQQSNPTQSLSQQSNPTQSPPQQSNPTQSPPQQSNPTQSPPQQSNPTQSPPQQSNPTQSPPQQSNPTQTKPMYSLLL